MAGGKFAGVFKFTKRLRKRAAARELRHPLEGQALRSGGLGACFC